MRHIAACGNMPQAEILHVAASMILAHGSTLSFSTVESMQQREEMLFIAFEKALPGVAAPPGLVLTRGGATKCSA